VVFSTTDRQSFSNVSRWKKKLEAECEDVEIVLVRNKVDLRTEVEM
jgi:GTPase SAR1 family protein